MRSHSYSYPYSYLSSHSSPRGRALAAGRHIYTFVFPWIDFTIVFAILRDTVMETSAKPVASAEPSAARARVFTRFRLVALVVVAALAAIGGVFIWRMRDVNELPDIGDPFDVEEVRRVVVMSDDENAFVKYNDARRQLTRYPRALVGLDWAKLTWSNAGKEVQDYVVANRPAACDLAGGNGAAGRDVSPARALGGRHIVAGVGGHQDAGQAGRAGRLAP